MFVDWLTIHQEHKGRNLPLILGGVKFSGSIKKDEVMHFTNHDDFLAACKKDYSSYRGYSHEGSYSSSVYLRCDGTTVSLSGNIGRLNRQDNLFNHDWNNTILIANDFLAKDYGLPPFTPATYHKEMYLESTGSVEVERDGAEITRIDLTKNYETGSSANAQAMIDRLAKMSMNHVRQGRLGSSTVSWGRAGGRQRFKAYIKHIEMMVNLKKHQKLKTEQIEALDSYIYALNKGIVRFELTLDRKTLNDTNFRYLENINMSALRQFYDYKANQLLNFSHTNIHEFDVDSLPSHVRLTASSYFQGVNLRKLMTKPTFYRHAHILREYGIDIAIPHDDETTFQPIINNIILTPAVRPTWYQLDVPAPRKSHLRIV